MDRFTIRQKLRSAHAIIGKHATFDKSDSRYVKALEFMSEAFTKHFMFQVSGSVKSIGWNIHEIGDLGNYMGVEIQITFTSDSSELLDRKKLAQVTNDESMRYKVYFFDSGRSEQVFIFIVDDAFLDNGTPEGKLAYKLVRDYAKLCTRLKLAET